VMPDPRAERREVAASVLLVSVLAPEHDGLAGEGLHADEVARRAGGGDVLAGEVPGFDGHAETGRLDLAGVDGGELGGGAEEGDYVCAAGDAGEVEVGAEGAVDVVEGGGGEGGAGAVDCFEGGERDVVVFWEGALLFEDGEVFGGSTEVGYLQLVDQAGHGEFAGVGRVMVAEGRAVVED